MLQSDLTDTKMLLKGDGDKSAPLSNIFVSVKTDGNSVTEILSSGYLSRVYFIIIFFNEFYLYVRYGMNLIIKINCLLNTTGIVRFFSS